MGKVDAAGRYKVRRPDFRDRVQANGLFLCGHGVDHHTVQPGLERFVGTGFPVEKHIQDFRREGILILWLHDGIPALHEVSAGVLYGRLDHAVNLVIGRGAGTASGNLLVLEDQKEAPCERFPVADILDEVDVFLAKLLTLRIRFLIQLPAEHGYVLIGIRFSGHAFKLQPHRRYFQPARKGCNNVELLL